jgi:hypothetical protein
MLEYPHPDGPRLVCQIHSRPMFPSANYYHSPRREQCGIGCISDVQVTGTQLYHSTLLHTEFIPLPVLRAHNLPCFKTFLRKERRFYAAVTYGERTWRTQSVQSMAQCVEWNESSDTLCVMSCFYHHVQLSLLQCSTTTLPYISISLC